MTARLAFDELAKTVVCPGCKSPLTLTEGFAAHCASCGEEYAWRRGTWDLIPLTHRATSPLWNTWDQLQKNGLVSYRRDPGHNLAVGKRPDCLAFSEFCSFKGLVLDVGCGPQTWPAYFGRRETDTRFMGIDPLIGRPSQIYTQLRALGEYLPFADRAFRHVVFATTLDHFVDPSVALKEARRVCVSGGEIDIWTGEKAPDAPRPLKSPAWYRRLAKPEEAEDLFHLTRLSPAKVVQQVQDAGMVIERTQVEEVDPFRCNHFLRVRVP